MKRFRNSRYLVSDDGGIFSEKSRRDLKPYLSGRKGSEYLQVELWIDGSRERLYVHRIVAELFLGDQPSLDHQVNHIDGDRLNNNAKNLEWVTLQGNLEHAYENGLRKTRASHCIQASKNGFGYVFPKMRNAEMMGFDSGSICKVLAGERNKCKGFYFASLAKGE